MRCKKHLGDLSSAVGVCASCLREHLFAVMSAQAERQAEVHKEWGRKEGRPQSYPSFPRSVSPYVNRRCHRSNQRFFSTPQVGNIVAVEGGKWRKSRGGGRISALILGIFRSKSDKVDPDSNGGTDPTNSSGASPSWFSAIVSGRLQKQNRTFSVDENSITAPRRRNWRNRERGMSPVRHSDDEGDEQFRGGSSGYSSESTQYHGWRHTPGRTPASTRRCGGRAPAHLTGMSFCLSPLVRASPSRQWKSPDISSGCDLRATARGRLSSATSFCKNRSRKLTDLGRNNNYYSNN